MTDGAQRWHASGVAPEACGEEACLLVHYGEAEAWELVRRDVEAGVWLAGRSVERLPAADQAQALRNAGAACVEYMRMRTGYDAWAAGTI